MSEVDGHTDSGYIKISDNIFRSKTPWREGTRVYDGYQLLESEERRLLTIKMIAPYNNEHVRQLKRLVDLPPIPSTIQILRIIEVHDDHFNKLYVVMERFGPNSLQSYLDNYPDFRHKVYDQSIRLTMQLVDAFCEIDREGFILENLTPRRVFFFPDDTLIKLSLIAVVENPHENDFLVMGSYRNPYQAPEVLQSAESSLKSSIFSLGVILARIWSGQAQHPFGEGAISQMYNIISNKDCDAFWVGTSEDDDISMLVYSMTESDPEERPTIEEILKHQFFRNIVDAGTGQAIIKWPPEEVSPEISTRSFKECLTSTMEACINTRVKIIYDITGVVNDYTTKLRNAQKHEMVPIFDEMLECTTDVHLAIAQSITHIDLSGTRLCLDGVDTIGWVVRVFKHVVEINLSFCDLQYGSLLFLRDAATDNIKIDKLNVTGNPELLASDLCSGIDFCAAIGCKFVYDIEHLSKKDRLKLKKHIRTRQDKDKLSDEGIAKNRRHLTKEERFQKLYKTSSQNMTRIRRFSLDFNKKDETTDGEKEDTNASRSMSGNARPLSNVNIPVHDIEGTGIYASTQNLKKVPQDDETTSSTDFRQDAVSDPKANAEPKVPDVKSEPEQASTGEIKPQQKVKTAATSSTAKKKIRPRTLGEYMKLKPVVKFEKAMKSLDEHQESQTESRPMHQRKLKTMATISDRHRFESFILKSGASLRHCIRNAGLGASTAFLKSSKGDSGYRSRSSFSEVLSCKSHPRSYYQKSSVSSGMDILDAEESNSILSTKPASLDRIEEVDTSAEKSESCDSGVLPRIEKNSCEQHHDPKRLIKQRFELTIMGVKPMEKRSERIQSWFQHAEFEEQPHDSYQADLHAVSLLKDCLNELMEDLLLQVENMVAKAHDTRSAHSVNSEKEFYNNVYAELERSCRQKSYKIEEITPEGGSIELYGCEIEFPPGAVKKKTQIRISVDYNPDNFPKFATAISPILGCKPSRFRVPVRVKLETWFVARHGQKICALIMSKANFRAKWREIDRVQLDERNVIEYDVPHFCGNIGVVQNENAGEGLYRLTNDVWMHSRTANIISLFCKGEKSFKKVEKKLKADHTHMISIARNIKVGVGNTIFIEIVCNEPPPPPPGMEIASVDGSDGRLEMDTETLDDNLCQLSFKPRPHPDKMPDSTVYEVVYRVKVLDSDGRPIRKGFTTPLNFYWPLTPKNTGGNGGPTQASASNQNISAPNIQAHGDVYVGGRGQSIRHDTTNEMGARPPKRPMIERGSDSPGGPVDG